MLGACHCHMRNSTKEMYGSRELHPSKSDELLADEMRLSRVIDAECQISRIAGPVIVDER